MDLDELKNRRLALISMMCSDSIAIFHLLVKIIEQKMLKTHIDSIVISYIWLA